MSFPCPNYVACPPQPVLIDYDSTTPDTFEFIGLGYGPSTPPPLNWTFDRPTAFAIVDSPLSQNDADTAAYNAAVSQAQSTWTPPGGVVPVLWENIPADDPAAFIGVIGGIDTPPLI